MWALKSSDLQRSGKENLASQGDNPGGQSFMSPFSGNLTVDEMLKLSNANFKETIDDFFKDKNITPLSQLIATPAFPTTYLLAQFASKAYEDYKKQETEAQYDRRSALPDGWNLLTTASNSSKTNGYFGAAYWHPEHQQVVIAHRGTGPTNVGALWTDLMGVVRNQYVRQMESASTFADKVVEVLREVKREKQVSFQLFFTGHSLGGWLAQVTTFTTKYLKKVGDVFLRSIDDNDCYHPHTVVFDSPGCKDMLSQMMDELDVRLDGRSIAIEHLDITSYLSAPNRINTCNKHVGTVYRIFPDLSDMGGWGKHTALHNTANHSMNKIVEAFDPETGQVYRDKQGQLKVQVVIDWPISVGINGGEEYKSFFDWAKHLNNYHPDVADESLSSFYCHPIRYQTKIYDERMKSLSIFSKEEKEFLEYYRLLRQWPEFYKPKELFSVMVDSQAQVTAEIMLQNFEIENDNIYCTDTSALQSLIPYVKRLLQLFPGIKENTKRASSSDELRSRAYQFETRRYVEQIRQSSLEFNSNILSFSEFLLSKEQKVLQLQMVNGEEWTGLINVYQDLLKNGCLTEGQYIILKLKRLLKLNQMFDVSKLLQSTVTPRLLLIACEGNQQMDEETKDVIRRLFHTVKQRPNIKIIFITESGSSTVAFLHHMGRRISGKEYVIRVEELALSDLTARSQEKLLEESVTFQGAKISLNTIMSAESALAKFLPLGALLEEKDLTIADPVPISNGYNEVYYIGRTFCHQKAIKREIYSDKDVQQKHVLLVSTEEEFKQLCQLNPGSNVHWLQKDKSGKLLWQQSQGSLETVRRYVDTESSQTYTADDLDKLLEQAEQQRVMLISDTAGMGKSTVLTHLSKQMKHYFPTKWVVRTDLNDHTDALKALQQEQIDKETAIEFVSEKLLKLKPGLEVELFKQSCEQKQKVRIVIMLDGFDEISPSYKDTVIALLQALRQTAVEQLWVTTRPHLRQVLEDELQQLSYKLESFSEKDQVEFLTKFWSLQDWFTEARYEVLEVEKSKLQIYAETLIKKLSTSITDKYGEFTGIPLQTRMLAEAFDRDVKIFYQSAEFVPELEFQLDLIGLYRRFNDIKYDIYYEEKLQVSVNNAAAIEQRERYLKSMIKDHQLLALKVLFTEEQVALLQERRECSFSFETLTRVGIVQVSHEGKPHFIHRTFAEYCVADCLVNRLTEGNNTSEQILAFILEYIFLENDYKVIRAFIDSFLSRKNCSNEVLKQCGNRISDLLIVSEMVLNQAAREGNVHIIGFLFDCLKAGGHTDTLTKLLLAQDNERKTAWHLAVFWGNMEVLQKLWEWANENLTRQELNNKYLSAQDGGKKTAWHVAAEEGNLKILQQLWEWAKESLTHEELNNNLLLAKDIRGKIAWHMAAKSGNTDVLEKIWEYAEERLTTEELKNKLLLATDKLRQTAWHYATWDGNIYLLQRLWELAKKNLTAQDLSNKLLLAKDKRGQTVWHMAAERGNLELLEKLWEWAREVQTPEDLNSKLMLETDNRERTAWHLAAECGKLKLLQKLWEWAKEVLTTEEINNLLLAGDDNEQTFLHVAAKRSTPTELEQLWDWATWNITQEEIKNLLLANDDHEHTVLNLAAIRRDTEVLDKMRDWAKQFLTPEEIRTVFGQRRK